MSEAGVTLLRNRVWTGVPEDVGHYWKHTSLSLIEAGDLWHQAAQWQQPTAAERGRMWEALSWLRFLDAPDAQLVVARAVRAPGAPDRALIGWKTLASARRQAISAAKIAFDESVAHIAACLDAESSAAAA